MTNARAHKTDPKSMRINGRKRTHLQAVQMDERIRQAQLEIFHSSHKNKETTLMPESPYNEAHNSDYTRTLDQCTNK